MVQLVPMEEQDFAEFLAFSVRDYANEHVQAGDWAAETALVRAQSEFDALLPKGAATPDQHLFLIRDTESGANVGRLWFAARHTPKPTAFVYELLIEPQYRRRGYASQAFLAMEEHVRALGLPAIGLHVFGHNHAAQALYAKLGYDITHVMMQKTLE